MASNSPFCDGTITKQLLKFRSCEFDLESIHTISLRELNITDVGCLSECLNLENLDLSNNKLTKLNKICGLKALKNLNISANLISSLDGLQNLDNLQSLNISGNLLGSVDLLRKLSTLQNLTTLKVNDKTAGLSNPMCNTRYEDKVLEILPSLTLLDDIRIRGKGSDFFYLCTVLDKCFTSLPSTKPLTTSDNDLAIKETDILFKSEQSQRVTETEQHLSNLLQECNLLNKQAVHVLTETKATQNLSINM